MDDRERHGRQPKGSKSVKAKLTEEVIPIIRFLLDNNRRRGILTAIGELYKVPPSAIQCIDRKQTWNHVPEVIWGSPRKKELYCPKCEKETSHRTSKASDSRYHYRECCECRAYKFRCQSGYQDPLRDAVIHHKGAKGEKHPNAKLTEKDVREIKAKYATKEVTQMQLAEEYSIHHSVISDIVRGIRWGHVTLDT